MSTSLLSVLDRLPPGIAALVRPLVQESVEIALLVYLDPEWRVLGIRHIRGSADVVIVPVRTVVRDALVFDARRLLMAHNHVSRDPRPSEFDMALTRRIARGLDAIGTVLFDHLVVGGDEATSLRAAGWL